MNHTKSDENKGKRLWLGPYTPLIVIVVLLLLSTIIVPILQGALIMTGMQLFMAGYFLIFGGIKLFDLHGFQEGFKMYDLLAKKWPTYGLVYPFLEVVLGLGYVAGFQLMIVNICTIVLMTFTAMGVASHIKNGPKIPCACLGTILNVPLTGVSLIENIVMGIMALLMLSI